MDAVTSAVLPLDLEVVVGSDSVHGSAYSATAGAWTSPLEAGDLLLIARSSDSDGVGAKSAPALAQSGATFDTIAYNNNRLNSSNSDCCVATWSTTVLTGTADPPTFAHALASQSCGALAIVRLREPSTIPTGVLAAVLPAAAAEATGAVSGAGVLAAGLPAAVA
ncbi:hypothetical protein, partial [Polymorphospora rubra]